jgi:hypothetical protein
MDPQYARDTYGWFAAYRMPGSPSAAMNSPRCEQADNCAILSPKSRRRRLTAAALLILDSPIFRRGGLCRLDEKAPNARWGLDDWLVRLFGMFGVGARLRAEIMPVTFVHADAEMARSLLDVVESEIAIGV